MDMKEVSTTQIAVNVKVSLGFFAGYPEAELLTGPENRKYLQDKIFGKFLLLHRVAYKKR